MKTCPLPHQGSVREEERDLRRGLASSLVLQQDNTASLLRQPGTVANGNSYSNLE